MKIFFSHSSTDKSLVREIKSKMYDFLDIWMDEKELIIGEDLEEQIEIAIEKADLLVVFLSKNSINSNWVKKELEWAVLKEQKLKRPFLIPVIIERETKLPDTIKKSKMYLELHSQEQYEISYFSEKLNKNIFQLIVKYGLQKPAQKRTQSENDTISAFSEFIKDEREKLKNKYLNLISSNSELTHKTLLLFIKEEIEGVIKEGEEKEKEWSELKEDEDMKLYGALGSTMFDIRVQLSKQILDKIIFVEKNNISNEEGLYLIIKYISNMD